MNSRCLLRWNRPKRVTCVSAERKLNTWGIEGCVFSDGVVWSPFKSAGMCSVGFAFSCFSPVGELLRSFLELAKLRGWQMDEASLEPVKH